MPHEYTDKKHKKKKKAPTRKYGKMKYNAKATRMIEGLTKSTRKKTSKQSSSDMYKEYMKAKAKRKKSY